ncbi:MAG TPA: hypothetical protein VLJ39_23045, partial [Tepidisphaeraceae bacterium]|nr:hypothetical protein [Tepidisphaeraceae bacterium]
MLREGNRARWFGWGLLLALAPLAGAQQNNTVEPSGEAALAWQLDGLSSAILGPNKPDAAYRQAAALLEQAGKLNPQEPRFPRLRTLALLRVGDTDAAIEALKAYRALRPADTVAQVQLIDLYASQMQTLDSKLQYITGLVDNPKLNLPPEVRAQLAAEAAALLAQKSPSEAAKMATRAVQIYPLPQATREYYQYVASRADLQPRVAGLISVLKANPNQPFYARELATLLAENGLANESLRWYEIAISILVERPPYYHNLVTDYTSEFVVADKLLSAGQAAGQILQQDPLDADAWFLRLTVDRASSPEVFNQSLEAARISFIRRWNAFSEEVITGHPSTQPVTLEPLVPDPTAPRLEP